MIFYNISKEKYEQIDSMINEKDIFLVVADKNEATQLFINFSLPFKFSNSDRNLNNAIQFECKKDYDEIGFLYFRLVEDTFVFEKMNVIFSKQFLFLLLIIKKIYTKIFFQPLILRILNYKMNGAH